MSTEEGRVFQRLQTLEAAERHLARLPLPVIALGLLVVTFLKVGITFRPFAADPLESFPTPRDTWAQLSYGMRTIHWIIGSEVSLVPIVAATGLLLLAITIVITASRHAGSRLEGLLVLVVILMGPAITVFLSNFGRPDAFTITGGLIVGLLGRRPIWAAIGAILMVLGNPEQAVVGTVLLLVLTLIPPLRPWRGGALISSAITLVGFSLLLLYARTTGVGSRLQYLPELLGNSIYGFVANLSLGIYAGYAILWIVLGAFALRLTIPQASLVAVAAIVIPLTITAVTLDQTRVFVGVTTASIGTITASTAPHITRWMKSQRFSLPIITLLAVGVFLPAFEVSADHVVRPPFAWLYSSTIPDLIRMLN